MKTHVKFYFMMSILGMAFWFGAIPMSAAEMDSSSLKPKVAPFRICVLDFTTIDEKGDKLFLNYNGKSSEIPPQCTLNDADRKSVNGVMQGFVRLLDAWDNSKTGDVNRATTLIDNEHNYAEDRALYHDVVKGANRPSVIGADYLSAYLGETPEKCTCIPSEMIAKTMIHLEKANANFPKDLQREVMQKTGVTHLIYGKVSDLNSRKRVTSGYGIQVTKTTYTLDLILNVVDLQTGTSAYSNVYTGSYEENKLPNVLDVDNNIYNSLIKNTTQLAAKDILEKMKPIMTTVAIPTPTDSYTLTVEPKGGFFFRASNAEIYVDGKCVGNGGDELQVSAGTHTIEVKASGYKTKKFEVDMSASKKITVKLES